MRLIKLEEARAGQKVARDVTDLRGTLLFKAETELTPELIARCKQRSVTHLFIDDEAPVPAGARPSEILQARELADRDIDHMFSAHEGNPLMLALRDAAHRYAAAKGKK
jgi:hypothetical protein